MTEARILAFKKLWAATSKNPVRAHARGPRKITLDAMRDDGLVRVVNRGYVLTSAGHVVAAKLRETNWATPVH